MSMTARFIQVLVDMHEVRDLRDPELVGYITSMFKAAGIPVDVPTGDIAYGTLTWDTIDDGSRVRFLWQAVEYAYDPHQKH